MNDPINPDHDKNGWSNGAEVIDIAGHLSFCPGNAVGAGMRYRRAQRAALEAALNPKEAPGA